MRIFTFPQPTSATPVVNLILPEFLYVISYGELFVPRNQTECDPVTAPVAKEAIRQKLQMYRRVKVIIVENTPGAEDSQRVVGDLQKFILSLKREFPEYEVFFQVTNAERFLR